MVDNVVIGATRKLLGDTKKTVAVFGITEEGSGKLILARTRDLDLDMHELIE